MLEIGNGSLTPDELYAHMTLWCMLAAPLLIGCDMTKMDDLVVSLFSNDEVLAVDQDPLGKQGYRLKQDGTSEVWIKPLADGTTAVAFFNRGEQPAKIAVTWEALKRPANQAVRDLWRQRKLGKQPTECAATVAPHGAELFRVGTPRATRG
jgi:alpha-galactosidase